METMAHMLSCSKRQGVWRRCDGFTLLEALVVVAILGILASIAAPSFRDLIASQRVKSVASDLHMGLIKTRSEAIKLNTLVTLTPKTGGWQNGWKIQYVNPLNVIVVLDDHQAPSGITFSVSPASVTYQSSGRIQGAATVNFQVVSSAVSTVIRCVSVDPSGRSNVKASSC